MSDEATISLQLNAGCYVVRLLGVMVGVVWSGLVDVLTDALVKMKFSWRSLKETVSNRPRR